ncbi:MAG: L,D-transpeptidase [Polyangiaceae bacterium]
MRSAHVLTLVVAGAVALSTVACKRGAASSTELSSAALVEGPALPHPPMSATAKIAAVAMQANVYERPSESSKKIGYLRLGAVVPRADKPSGTDGCAEGWYAIPPRGYVCNGATVSIDVDQPLVKAASRRPDAASPMPYSYGFVRSIAPLYLRVPTPEEQQSAEFKLSSHLSWWSRRAEEANRPDLGAMDALREVDPSAPERPASNTMSDGVFFGGESDRDPLPFWLEAAGTRTSADRNPQQGMIVGRRIPNVASFQVPPHSFFANRVKRHTGLAFIGAFDGGVAAGGRRFAVTVDMRLVPIDKVKPESGSAWHGVELGDAQLPVAFARPCDRTGKDAAKPCVHPYQVEGSQMKRQPELLKARAYLPLTGQSKKARGGRYLETRFGFWVRAKDVGIAVAPQEWPQAAKNGERWIDVSIEEQTLTLWEGTKPLFVTLVSTGQDGLDDPKTTKSTPRGLYRMKSKHITATMDSDERSSQSGGAAPSAEAGESSSGQTKGHGFELRDVPFVQYFHDGYALHAAYWHDVFGLARSHGCINLSPLDAMRVFKFTGPDVPEGWHGINVPSGKGTSIIIHR